MRRGGAPYPVAKHIADGLHDRKRHIRRVEDVSRTDVERAATFDIGAIHLEARTPGGSEQRDGEAALRGAELLY